MRQITQNTFNQGMKMDLNPLTTPNNILTDCLNGTIITYNGNEFVLQNDQGNCKVSTARLKPGFIPMGMAEYGGIIYVASYNPITGDGEYGCFPSPQRDFSTSDFEELQPVNFNTAQFILETNTTVETSTKHIGKLSEPELFELHPGDKYVITYIINEPPAGPGVDIDDTTEMNDYISKDIANRKLFRLKFYKITDANNLVELDSSKIKVIENQLDIEDEYVYFTENSNSTLAVGLEFEQLDLFNANVIDTSRKTNSNKTVAIESIGKSASLADFEGIKVEITQPEAKTFFLDKAPGTKKASAIIDGLAAGDNFECSITPYCDYALFPKLRQDFKLTIGKFLSGGTGVNDLFQYYIDNTADYLKLDFDFKFEGNSTEGTHLYVEFYDPWSDYSVVKRVDNPTYYGLNSVIVDIIDEPRIDQFDSTTVGGTPPDKLITNPDTVYEKTLLNSTNKIRVDATLRRNHFYIVRISGVDRDIVDGDISYTHYDFYKGLYTNDMFNDIYIGQSASSVSDPGYVMDFNQLDFDISSIGYDTTVTPTYSVTQPIVNQNFPEVDGEFPLMTGNDYYKVRDTEYPTSETYRNSKQYETDAEYNVQLDLQGLDRIFGTFKSSMLSVEFPNLIASDAGGSGYKPTIVEQTIPSTPATGSRAEWIATALSSVLYKVTVKAITKRSVEAPATFSLHNGTKYDEVSLIKSFHYYPNANGPLFNTVATIEISCGPNYLKYVDNTGAVHQINYANPLVLPNSADDPGIYAAFEAIPKRYSGFWGCMSNRAQYWWWAGAPGDYGGDTGERSHRENILFLRNAYSGAITACRTHDYRIAEDFFNTLKVASNVTTELYLYYPNSNLISKNGQLTTTFQFKGAPIITTFAPDQVDDIDVKTYLSTFRFRVMNSIEEFNPTVINDYIATRISDSVIVDNKQTVRDGFIPYITSPHQSIFNLNLDDIVINQAADADTYTTFLNAQTIGLKDPAFAGVQNAKPHKTLFSKDPTKYTSMIGKFEVGGAFDDTVIDPELVHITLKDPNEPKWLGWNRIGGTPKKTLAPDLYIDFQMS